MIHDNIKELETLNIDDRNQYLRLRTEDQRFEIFDEWAQTISLTDLAEIHQPYRSQIQDLIVGNPQKGLPALGRIFYIEPVPGKGPVRVQTGFRRNKRVYKEISEKTPLPADLAISAFCQWGPLSKVKSQRDFLREYDPFAPAPKKRQRQTRKKAAKKPETQQLQE